MDWHARYLQQAAWTRDLRRYLFDRAGLAGAGRILEVGCGTGAVLGELDPRVDRFGLDLDLQALRACAGNIPGARLIQGDAACLPYPDAGFDIVFCHFLLLWVEDPLQVVKEMGRVGRDVLLLAEPDYTRRVEEPEGLRSIGDLQTASLRRQGADPSFGSRLAETCRQAGLVVIESGPLREAQAVRTLEEWRAEWAVIEEDLRGWAAPQELREMKRLDEDARARGERRLHVPTHFAWARAGGNPAGE